MRVPCLVETVKHKIAKVPNSEESFKRKVPKLMAKSETQSHQSNRLQQLVRVSYSSCLT